ncbi:MAG: hypothetical protein Q8R57_05605 [Bacteroidota bacterium]|nr:hypothetical protein [Bacteroidota bacterium]
MKTKINQLQQIFLISFLLLGSNLFAQLKVLDGGRICIGSNDVASKKVHITSDIENMALKITTNRHVSYTHLAQFEATGDFVKGMAIMQNGVDNAFHYLEFIARELKSIVP